MLIFIVTKFGADWFIFVDVGEQTKSNAAIVHKSRPAVPVQLDGPMIELIQILLDMNILPKFGADWSIYADDRV